MVPRGCALTGVELERSNSAKRQAPATTSMIGVRGRRVDARQSGAEWQASCSADVKALEDADVRVKLSVT